MRRAIPTRAETQTQSRARGSEVVSTGLWRRLQEGGFILLSALSVFLLIALITYHEGDPGWSHTATVEGIQNAAGKLGAWFSDVFLYLFGLMAYMFPLISGFAGVRVFQNRTIRVVGVHRLLWSLRIVGFSLAVMAGCGLASLHFGMWDKSFPFSAGGVLGQIISEELDPVLGTLGSTLSLCASFLAGITLTTGLSWLRLMDLLGKSVVFCFTLCKTILVRVFAGLMQLQTQNKSLNRTQQNSPRLAPRFSNEYKTPKAWDISEISEIGEISGIREIRDIKPLGIKSRPKTSAVSQLVSHSSPTSKALPDVRLLEPAEELKTKQGVYSAAKLEALSREVEARLLEFGVQVTVVGVYPGPVITRFELELAAGLKVSKISTLAKDLARALSVNRVRVVEVIPGKAVVGLEIPNEYRELVRLREILESNQYLESQSPLSLALGKDIGGNPVVVNLSKMPHLLVAGTTGSGKSVGINAMLLSLLYKATVDELRLILIDPKMLELSIYEGIPHLLTPVVTDMKDAANALRWCVAEMERRYRLMAAVGVRNLVGYNRKISDAEADNEPLFDPLWLPEMGGDEERPRLNRLPYIVVIIDEFADMMMVVGKKVEELIARIAQKARAAGIHLILATQRPSVDVITGLIKANVPTRIAFQVSSRIDSRTILDQQGAEQLLGHGDMLYLAPGTGVPERIHGAFVADEEVHAVVKALKHLGKPEYAVELLGGAGFTSISSMGSALFADEEGDGEHDDLYDEAVKIVTESRKASISHLQRRLKIGYNRAARMIETMEMAGIVSQLQSNGGREVLVGEPIEE